MSRFLLAALAACALLLSPRLALAHAHLMSSTPAANATVAGPDVTLDLHFNSRVDGQRSSLTLVMPDGKTQPLSLDKGSESTLHAHAMLKHGTYTLRWMALAPDGHITRGEIPFSVK